MADKDTIVESRELPSGPETHEDGWLTAESYLAWVASSENLFLGEKLLSQPPPMSVDEADLLDELEEEVAA